MGAGCAVPKQGFPRASLQLVLAGGYHEPSANMYRSPLSVHYHPIGDPQDAIVDNTSRVFGICLPGERLEVVRRFGGSPADPADLTRPMVVDCMLRLYREFRLNDEASSLAIEGLTCELLAHFSRPPVHREEGRPSWLQRAYEMIADEPSKHHSLTSLAYECAVHPSHLAREFRRAYGCSVGDHLRDTRLRVALALLRSSDLPLEEIARRTGFHDASHLSRTVRRLTGTTPGKFR